MGEKQVICGGLVPAGALGGLGHISWQRFIPPLSFQPLLLQWHKARVSLDSQESACSEETIRM